MAAFVAAAKAGDIHAIHGFFDGQQPVDIEAQDENGWTALMHAAKQGNADLVQELLARGADPRGAAVQDVANEHPHIASILANASNAIAQGFQYMPAGNFPGYANLSPPQGGVQYGYAPQGGAEFYYPPPAMMSPPMGLPEQSDPPAEGVPGAEGGVANLPPPDVAKTIPCRYFPNCKYGAKCIFAHPGPVNGGSPVPVPPPTPRPSRLRTVGQGCLP